MSLPKLRDSVEPMEATIEDSEVQADTMLHYGRAYEKALMRRVDRRLLPILGALYAVSLVDRVNVWAPELRDDTAGWAKFR
jgi:hypothetical protein